MEAFVTGIVSALSIDQPLLSEVESLRKQLHAKDQEILDLLNREEDLLFKCDKLVSEKIHAVTRMEVAERELRSNKNSMVQDADEEYIRTLDSENTVLRRRLDAELACKEMAAEQLKYYMERCDYLEAEYDKVKCTREEAEKVMKEAREATETAKKVEKMLKERSEESAYVLKHLAEIKEELKEDDEMEQYKARVREVGKKLYATETKLNLTTEEKNLIEKENSELKEKMDIMTTGYRSGLGTDIGFSTFF